MLKEEMKGGNRAWEEKNSTAQDSDVKKHLTRSNMDPSCQVKLDEN